MAPTALRSCSGINVINVNIVLHPRLLDEVLNSSGNGGEEVATLRRVVLSLVQKLNNRVNIDVKICHRRRATIVNPVKNGITCSKVLMALTRHHLSDCFIVLDFWSHFTTLMPI